MQDALAVQVAQRAGEVRAEVGELAPRSAGAGVGDQVLDRRAGQRLHDDGGPGAVVDLVGAHDVRVGEALEQPALAQQPAPRRTRVRSRSGRSVLTITRQPRGSFQAS